MSQGSDILLSNIFHCTQIYAVIIVELLAYPLFYFTFTKSQLGIMLHVLPTKNK